LNTTSLQFPVIHILSKIKKRVDEEQQHFYQSYEEELMQPLSVTVEEIALDLYKFVERFPYDIIPHINDKNEVNDKIHNYNSVESLP